MKSKDTITVERVNYDGLCRQVKEYMDRRVKDVALIALLSERLPPETVQECKSKIAYSD